MPRKKSTKRAAETFGDDVTELESYYESILDSNLSKQEVTWAVEAALMKLYAYFEKFILHALVAAVNNDTTTISGQTGIAFPKHLTDEVCEFIVTGGSYFDFRGRDGLIKTLKSFLPADHYLIATVKEPYYRNALEQLTALRNLAAHESTDAKRRAREILECKLSAAGAWLKRQQRFEKMASRLRALADEVALNAPY